MGCPQCSESRGISFCSYVCSCYGSACSYACGFALVGKDSVADGDLRYGEKLMVWFTLSAEEAVIVGMVYMKALTALCTCLI